MLFYCHVPQGNFGDDLNPWLWSRLAPEVCDGRAPALFLGIGTILSQGIPAEPVKVVFGSGWADSRPPVLDEKWKVYCVRGPLTAARLKLDPALAVADPAILVRRVPLPAQAKCHAVSFMPHHWSFRKADWQALCARVGLHFIDPRAGVDQVLAQIQQTRLLLAEAMHGAIVADALRVPWIPVRIHSGFSETKWRDWTQSIRVPLQLAEVPPVQTQPLILRKRVGFALKKGLAAAGVGRSDWGRHLFRLSSEREINNTLRILESLRTRHAAFLSDNQVIEEATARLCDKLAKLRVAWQAHEFELPE